MKVTISVRNDLNRRHAIIFLAGVTAGVVESVAVLMIRTFFPVVFFWHIPRIFASGKPETVNSVLSPSSYKIPLHNAKAIEPDIPSLKASSYMLVNPDTGEILAQRNPDMPLPVASLSKLMTAVVVLDTLGENSGVTVTAHAAGQIPTKIGIKKNERFTVSELLAAMLITSANDAAAALQDAVESKLGPGTFVAAMNAKASKLGMKHSVFDNPEGYDSAGEVSSSRDLTILTRYALSNYPLIAALVKTDSEVIPFNFFHGRYVLKNWNGLLGVYPGTFGVKTGITPLARNTAIIVAKRTATTLLAVVLGEDSALTRDLEIGSLLDLGYYTDSKEPMVNLTPDILERKYGSWSI